MSHGFNYSTCGISGSDFLLDAASEFEYVRKLVYIESFTETSFELRIPLIREVRVYLGLCFEDVF